MHKQIKILGNIETDHPYYDKMILFIDNLLLEVPFSKHLNEAVVAILNNKIITQQEYIILFPKGINDITPCFIDYLNHQTINYCNQHDIQGVKAILKTLIMFQIRMKPNMPDNFKKVFNYNIFKLLPTTHITYFYALVDTLWYCAGDTATDYNYYTKRFLLGNIYLETCLYACSDTSDNYNDTEDYLVRCFDKIKYIEKLKEKLPNVTKIQENITSFLGKLRYNNFDLK